MNRYPKIDQRKATYGEVLRQVVLCDDRIPVFGRCGGTLICDVLKQIRDESPDLTTGIRQTNVRENFEERRNYEW
jgi:hypothetical protein